MKLKIVLISALVIASTAFGAFVLAEDSVIIGGTVYTCQNTCVVTITPNGGYMVTDSDGGYIKTRKVTAKVV